MKRKLSIPVFSAIVMFIFVICLSFTSNRNSMLSEIITAFVLSISFFVFMYIICWHYYRSMEKIDKEFEQKLRNPTIQDARDSLKFLFDHGAINRYEYDERISKLERDT